MYAINGTPLHNPERGWILESATTTSLGTTITRPEVTLPGFDGDSFPEMDGIEERPALTLSIVSPESQLTTLRTLLRQPQLMLSIPGSYPLRSGTVQLSSLEQERQGIGSDPDYLLTAQLVLPGLWLRTPSTDQTAALDAATKTIALWAAEGLTGKVGDATVRIAGPVTNPKVKDTSGSWFSYGKAIPAGSYLRFDAVTGRAWLTTSDAWTGGTEVTTSGLSTGPGPHALRITPHLQSDLSSRGTLMVTSTARSDGAAVTVRARGAHLL